MGNSPQVRNLLLLDSTGLRVPVNSVQCRMTHRILIAGCGDIGTRLGKLLQQKGHQVWALRRNIDVLPSSFNSIEADLSQPIHPSALPTNLNAVYYTAAASQRSDAGYHQAYVQGLKNLIAGLKPQTTIKRFIFTSSTSVYGQHDGNWIDESAPTTPIHFTGKRMLEAESHVHQSPWDSACVRFGGIYGPGRTYLLRQAAQGNAMLKPNAPGGIPYYTNRIHQDDCAGLLAHLLDSPILPKILNGVDDSPAPYNTVVEWMANQLNISVSTDPHPRPGQANKRLKNLKLHQLGYQLTYPTFRHGYQPMIDQLRQSDDPVN